jgi:hypothetical protein
MTCSDTGEYREISQRMLRSNLMDSNVIEEEKEARVIITFKHTD